MLYGMDSTTLYRLRRQMKLTQAAFAKLLAVTPNTYARLERDEMTIRPAMERLILCVVHLHEQGDDFVEELVRLGGRKRR
jgi:transcriptional regulator with XRE-family HTH domain